MKKLIGILLLCPILAFVASSCVDKDYDWDGLDKGGVIQIPPIPLGTFDTIWVFNLDDLPEHPDPSIPVEINEMYKSDTLHNFFGEHSVKKYFSEPGSYVEIAAKTDAKTALADINVDIYFVILKEDGEENKQVKIPMQHIENGDNQDISIRISSEYAKDMENAHHLQMKFVLRSNSLITIHPKDYLVLKDAIMKTGGLHIEL